MAVNPDEDTEFNDALRKHGILPPKPTAPRTPSPPPGPSLHDELSSLSLSELNDELDADGHDSDTERFIASLQRQKLDSELHERRSARFGRVYPISREDYTREVTDASKEPEPPLNPTQEEDEDEEAEETRKRLGTGVVCFLYKDGHDPSTRAFSYLHVLAPRYPQTKFVSIIGNKCIPNYPDRNLPTLILYRGGKLLANMIAWGTKESDPGTLVQLEAILVGLGIVDLTKMSTQSREEERSLDRRDRDRDEDSDQENTQPSSFVGARQRKKQSQKSKDDDDDSDFDI